MPRTPEAILKSLVADVQSMRWGDRSNQQFGTFGEDSDDDVAVSIIYWPNLALLIDEAEAALRLKPRMVDQKTKDERYLRRLLSFMRERKEL